MHAIAPQAAAAAEEANATVVAAEARETPPPTPDPTAGALAAINEAVRGLSAALREQASTLPPGIGWEDAQCTARLLLASFCFVF